MNLNHFLIFALIVVHVNGEPFSLIAGTLVTIGTGVFYSFKDRIKCTLYECCQEPDVFFNPYTLSRDLDKHVFGQHLVKDIVVNALKSHFLNENPKKPLVLSFHGYTGCGKNYVAEIIANNTYKKGFQSSFVHHIVATSDFPDKSQMEKYKSELRNEILNGVKKCQRSLFIFDEADKLAPELLASIKPYLEYYGQVSNVDIRKSVFIFLSNKGGNDIAEITLHQYNNGYPREELKLENFERVLMSSTYNEDGGLHMSELISNHLIDHFLPFLPLQKEHVRKCIESHLRKRGRSDLLADADLIDRVLSSLQYFPNDTKAFSSSGCKRVDAKTDLEIIKIRSIVGFNDEL
ncbi:unnamed protein product [Caenorhabditis bovis]|uniref:Torsin n=1 Tax=Caenorhabditis bovis TaxID=2654633 RepID=A0A8S1EUH3_9PELO|nr:unnamed protein product [Caenorhabditis bovis]